MSDRENVNGVVINPDKRKGDKSAINPYRKCIAKVMIKNKKTSRVEYARRYYERHKDDILKKQRERHKSTYIPKKEGWTKPKNDDEIKERIKEAKRRDRAKQYQYEKVLRAKDDSELTDSERVKLEKIRERGRRYYRKKKYHA